MDDLSRLRQFAFDHGVDLLAERERGKLWLCSIDRMPDAPKGRGATVVEALCELADQTGEPIHLAVALGAPELIRYYERFGFALDGGGHVDEPTMHRLPATCQIS